MEKTCDPKQTEEKWYAFWEKQGYFQADPTSGKKPFAILMPPPNLTGSLHLGHAMEHSILDAIARYKRMQGFDVLLLPGVDHAGIQFEGTLDKLLAKEGLSKRKLGREAWLKRAWKFKDENYKSFHNIWKVFGLSADWSREVFTLDPKVSDAVLTEFKAFWDQDLLYKGAYIVQWCPKCGTAIEDVEMEYQEREEKLYYVKYPIIGSGFKEFITVATARPETIFADVAIAVYPGHPKYEQFVGKEAMKPLFDDKAPGGRGVQIIKDSRVEKDFGTGALKITPGHDLLDYQIGKDNKLPILHAIDKTGRLTDIAKDAYGEDLSGLKVEEGRTKAVEILQRMGAIDHIENYVHSAPVCERCKTTIEPLISEEWFVKMEPLAAKALANMDKINFMPKNYHKILATWLSEIHDWSISRSLWWGHRFPVWYCEHCNKEHRATKDDGVVISHEEPKQGCPDCGKKVWQQEDKVLDTWFSSGMWPLATLGWPEETLELKKYYPWSLETSAGEIKYLWIARMIMLGLWFRDDIPFTNMFFHGMIRDLEGRKFSKSLGNGVDPNELRTQWGTDATRMTLYTYAAPGRDGRASRQTMDERTKGYRNFATKIRNIAHFVLDLKPDDAATTFKPMHKDDKWIVQELAKTIKAVTDHMEHYQLHLATETLYEFIWHVFADIYIEKAKPRRAEAQPTLEHVLATAIVLLHPFIPFITEELYQKLPNHKESIMIAPWPQS